MRLIKRIKEHSFELQHVIILFIILLIFQIILIFLNKYSTSNLISNTMKLYRKDSAERIANLSTTSLELLLEQSLVNNNRSTIFRQDVVQAFNIILSQQMLQVNVDEMCILVRPYQKIYTIDVHGEYQGAVYLKITPDLTRIKRKISIVFQETNVIFTALILFGLLAMFYITSYTVEERDLTKELLFKEREFQLKKEIAHEKEAIFTQRIYHAHHKAEKIMGFIKEEIRNLTSENIVRFKSIVTKYSNFISRVIYDMKLFDSPIYTTRNTMFHSNINEILNFLVEHVFTRVYSGNSGCHFKLDFDENFPIVSINEYVIWETLEPLIQNSIDHNSEKEINILLKTRYYANEKRAEVIIQDDGKGIDEELLEKNEFGIKKLFLEYISSKKNSEQTSGYGCYIASEICTKKCGWQIDAENCKQGGCRMIITFTV